MKSYYFCNTHMAFASGRQVVRVRKGEDIKKIAEQWAKTNGYKCVYVYTMDHDFIWSYDF